MENKELDLLDLLNKGFNLCKSFVVNCKNIFISIIKFHIKNIFILIPFLIIAVSLSVYQSVKEHRKQFCEFMLQVNGSNSFVVSDLVKVLNQTINPDSNNVFFARALGVKDRMELDKIKKITSLETFYVVDLNNNNTRDYIDYENTFVEDTANSRMPNLLDVRIHSTGEFDFNTLQQQIVKYLSNDPYMKKVGQERIRSTQEKIQALDIEVAQLDSLRKQQLTLDRSDLSLDVDGKSSILLGKQPTSYYKDMMYLKDQKSKLEEDLALCPDVVSIYSGVKVDAERPIYSIFLKNIVPLYLISLVLALVVYFRRNIVSIFKK